MNLNVSMIENGFIITMSTVGNKPHSLYVQTPDELREMVSEILKGVTMTPATSSTPPQSGPI